MNRIFKFYGGSMFNIGDVVTLKSGSPDMTVSKVVDHTVTCVWFSGKEKKIDNFQDSILEAVMTEEEISKELNL